MNYEYEIKELKRRVDELEGEVGGEKVVTRYIFETVKRTETKIDRLDNRMDGFDSRMNGFDSRVGGLEGEIKALKGEMRSLREDMPTIVADAMRDVLKQSQ